MPATEQTWYNQKLMHVIFGVATLVMAIATFWLLAKDHNREWKKIQLDDRRKDAWMFNAERDKLSDEYLTRMDQYEQEMRAAQSSLIPAAKIEQFKHIVEQENARLEATGVKPAATDFTAIDTALAGYNSAAQQAADASVEADANSSEDAAIAEENRVAESLVDEVIAKRRGLFEVLGGYVNEARRRESTLVDAQKIVNGKRTAALSELTLLVGHGGDEQAIDAKQETIDSYDKQLEAFIEGVAAAKDYRTDLEAVLSDVNSEQTKIAKELGAMKTELSRLDEQAYKNTSNIKEWITRWPVLNALYDGNVRIQQNWLPDLTINYNFSQVARFDRCITCHRAISKTAPGTATDPAYPTIPDAQREFTLQLATPEEKPEGEASLEQLRETYGLVLSETGIIDTAAVTVHYALPETPAAVAGLESGDVIEQVGDMPMYNRESVATQLLSAVETWGKPLALKIKRGLDHPYTSHPRLDLYLTDLSPHPVNSYGCTICHDGQGSGTSFKWASHTPDNAQEQVEWTQEHDWFDNHHWIFPMKPARFVESNCVKCHHQKGQLEASEKYPEPPAAKLVAGWTTVEQYGCFGCHEINGFSGPDESIGPDVRLAPNYTGAAQELLSEKGLTDHERKLAERLVEMPSDNAARQSLLASVEADKQLALDPQAEGEPRLSDAGHKMAALLKAPDSPGQYRKVGPSLRHVKSKVDFDWLYTWIKQPSNFRPSTRMPQFFGLEEHLEGPGDEAELAVTHAFEPIEIRALAEYLLNNSVAFDYQEPPQNITEAPSVERGKWLFQSRGCLACHQHGEFEGTDAVQGPELSRLAAKFGNERGKKWLYSWLRQPNRYHARTKMPNLFLEPIEEKDNQGTPTGKVTDPAADIAEYLLSVETDWKPTDAPSRELTADEQQALADLALEWLASPQIPEPTAREFIEKGVPAEFASRVKPDERLLIGITDENRTEKLLAYVGRRTVAKYGCFGCHDIPGFEDAKPIGTGLADWGRKESSKLAFENIQAFLATHGIDPAADEAHDEHQAEHGEEGHDAESHASHGHLEPLDYGPEESYFVQAINSHSRDGFLWQKLRYPRSYDYKTTANKGYNERLRMPKFPFTDKQREEVMTFILGLVNEPPAEKYIYQPDARMQAIVEGKHVLDKFNCAGCHTLKMQRWDFAYGEDAYESPVKVTDYPFLAASFSPQEIAASLKTDDRGLRHASLHGLPVMDEETGQPMLVDEDGLAITREELAEAEAEEGEDIPVFYKLTLWDNALLNGEPFLMGLQDVMISAADGNQVGPAKGRAYPAEGGDLARYLFPHVIAKAKESNPQAKGNEAWGWLPPPLMHEGEKVQTEWLHSFLMNPTHLRPAVVMRMPNFHMSSDDAAKLVNYFAAASDMEFPYEYNAHQQPSYLAKLRKEREEPLDEAMQIVVSGNYCVKCHSVSDFHPKGDESTFGPNLAEVGRRLRPDYIRNWVANPKRILPYTGMPVNIPYNPTEDHLGGLSQDLYHGTSLEQLGGLVDLLMNFEAYTRQQTDVTKLVDEAKAKPPAANPAAANTGEAAPAEASGDQAVNTPPRQADAADKSAAATTQSPRTSQSPSAKRK